MIRVLVIDSERSMRNALKERLEYEKYKVDLAESHQDGLMKIDLIPFDIILCGSLPNGDDHLSLLRNILGKHSLVEVIILSSDYSITLAVDCIRRGAFDFIPKPVDYNRLLGSLRSAAEKIQSRKGKNLTKADLESDELGRGRMQYMDELAGGAASMPTPPRGRFEGAPEETEEPDTASYASPAIDSLPSRKRVAAVEEIIGESDSIKHVKRLIDRVAPSEARVLITGSNGTGKELVARWLHEKSSRATGPFVEVNCAAIPSELIESELFGHEKGSFTSAIKQRKGKFEQAHGGTLFLDEIGDMSLSAQAKVLRALQENRISRVGSDKDIEVNVRVVAATNKNLRDEIDRCNFREDLYHRLSVIIIRVPALRERADDIPLLVNSFMDRICAEYAIKPKKVAPKAIEMLKEKPWTGNVRELRNVVERLIILSGDEVSAEDVEIYAPEMV